MHEDPKYTSKQASDPVVVVVLCTGASKLGKTVALISLILEQYIFSPSVNIDDGWIPVKKYIKEDLGRPPHGFLKKRMTTIYVDSRKRVAGSDSDFEVDLGESLRRPARRLQNPPSTGLTLRWAR